MQTQTKVQNMNAIELAMFIDAEAVRHANLPDHEAIETAPTFQPVVRIRVP